MSPVDTQMDNRHVKSWATSLVIRETENISTDSSPSLLRQLQLKRWKKC